MPQSLTLPLRRFLSLLAVVGLLAALPACDSGGDEPPPAEPVRISGRYDGTTNVDGTAVTLQSTLSETSNNVSGSGTLRITNSVAVTATGSHVPPDFNITFRATGLEDLNFAGTSNADASVLRGRLNGSGFDDVEMTLIRSNPSGVKPSGAAETSLQGETTIPPGVTTFRELLELELSQ